MSEPRDPRDDELSAMLAARADRVPEDAGRRVLHAVRAEMGAPRGAATFAVLPVSMRGRGGKAPAGWAAVALVAALVLAVTGGRLDNGTTKPAATGLSPLSTGAAAAPSVSEPPGGTAIAGASPTAEASTPAAVPARIMTAAELVSGLAHGTLDGRLVLVSGRLTVLGLPCPYPVPPDCFAITVAGLENVTMTWDGKLSRDTAAAMQGELAFVVRGSTLVLVGRVTGDPAKPVAPLDLIARPIPVGAPDAFALTVASGWLVVGGLHSCPALGVGATPCPGPPPELTDKEPSAEGIMNSDLQVPVAVAAAAPGVRRGDIVTPGPFLIRTVRDPGCPGMKTVDLTACLSVRPPSLQVIARYDPASVVRVVQVPSTCAQPGYGVTTTLTCNAAIVAALDAVPAGTSVVAVEFTYGGRCPPGMFCRWMPFDPDTGAVTVLVSPPGPDLWVAVRADAAGVVTVEETVPFPFSSSRGSPAPTP